MFLKAEGGFIWLTYFKSIVFQTSPYLLKSFFILFIGALLLFELMSIKKIFQRLTNWELWNFYVLYAPISPVWFWYCLRSWSMWFFSSSNPTITFGGFEGEGKKEMYDQLPSDLVPRTIYIMHDWIFEDVKKRIAEAGFIFPFIVKPDVGMKGILFRKIENEDQLLKYHERIPVEYIIQEMVQYPMEVSVFYIRHPQDAKGSVTGFLHKIPLQVIGNGKDTLAQLIWYHPKGQKRIGEMQSKHKERWNEVIAFGEKYMLSYAANHNRGAHFFDLKEHIDDKLAGIFDKISHDINDFFYGRYDIMCSNVEDLKNGKNFIILEYNGCGAEPNHIYDTGYSLPRAYKEILKHWKALYSICKYNSQQGIKPWPLEKGRKFLAEIKAHFKLIREADKKI